ncbi:MAG: TlpA family protein disulfide reductase [Xanthobacteraceae bacterium]|nr:TlpA family protein disulfide reductase [Xanthobacteraceae bacterium]
MMLGGGAALSCAAPARATQAGHAMLTPLPGSWTGHGKPAFLLDDLHGQPRSLRDFAGRAAIVHFFATWCEPCTREMASLQRFAASARNRPLAVVAIDVAEVDLRVRAFFETMPVDFPVLLDRDRAVARAWRVSALPTSFVLGADLVPRLYAEGDIDWASATTRAAIEPFIPATPSAAPHATAPPSPSAAPAAGPNR